MITEKAFEVAASETYKFLEQVAYEGINYDDSSEFDGIVSVTVEEMFENVDLTDEDMECIYSHEASVWASVAARVNAIDPEWEVDFKARTFTNEAAFEEALVERAARHQERADMMADYRKYVGY